MIFRPTSGLDKAAGKAFRQRTDKLQAASNNKLLHLSLATFFAITAAFFSVALYAQSSLSGLLGEADSEILSPDEAFVLEALPQGDDQLIATFSILDGYYLYRDKITFNIADDDNAALDVVSLTEGVEKYDEFFGNVDVNRNIAVAEVLLKHSGEARDITIDVGYQGCADLGICYPPQTKQVTFTLAAATAGQPDNVLAAVATDGGTGSGGGGTGELIANASADAVSPVVGASSSVLAATAASTGASESSLGLSEQDRLAKLLGSSSLPFIFVLFMGLGVLLAFTPCVLPMVPILSGLIVGQSGSEKVTVPKATLLSVIYVLFMALTYAVAGVLVAVTGAGTGFLQNPWVLGGFALLMVVLSLSMFGMYELQMPQKLQQKLNSISNSQKGGNFAGVAIMGFLSALIVGPCVTAPLVAALIFIADTGDAVVGGVALFALGLGMGLPLIAVGASCGHFLPRAGVWMERVKGVFGVLLLAMAIWMLSRFMPAPTILAMSAALAVVSGIYLGGLDHLSTSSSGWQRLSKGGGILAMLYGAALLVGALSGSGSLLTPLKSFSAGGSGGAFSAVTASNGGAAGSHELEFQTIKATDDLDNFLLASSQNGQPVILDFYADWCVSCKEMEAFVFTDPKVMGEMSKAVLLRADVTKNDKIDRALLKRFGLFGPPAILFFDPSDGEESRNGRVVGYMDKGDFYSHISRVYKDMSFTTQAKQVGSTSTAVASR